MNKLTLINGGAMACLILMCLLVVQGCRKDRLSPPSLDNPQLIKKEVLTKWLETNKTAKLFSFDWRKARQAVIQGKNVLRVPVLNIDKISSLKEKEGNTNTTPHLNNNHFNGHAPEVFFVQGGDNDALHPFMLNFIPTDKNKEFGENDVWTGNLYEWDLNGDSLFVQEYEKGKLKDKYGLKPKISAAETDLNLVVKNNSLQSLKGLKDKKVGSVWTWLGSAFNNVWQAINWLGYYLGIPGAWINSPYGTGIIVRTWDIHSVFDEPPSMDYYDDYAGTSVYVAAGSPVYNSYITPAGGTRVEYNPTQYDYPLRDDEIITLNDKILTAVGLVYYDEPNLFQFYTETSQGVSMQEMLKSYLDTNGWTDENKEFARSTLRYLSDNRDNVDFEDFKRKLLNRSKLNNIINFLGITDPVKQNFLLAHDDVYHALDSYLVTNGNTSENKGFVDWAAGYLIVNNNVSFEEFKTEYLDYTLNPANFNDVPIINNGIELEDAPAIIPSGPKPVIGSTTNRNNIEDMTYGTNHDATGVNPLMLTKSDANLFISMNDLMDFGTTRDAQLRQVTHEFVDLFRTNTSPNTVATNPILNQKVEVSPVFANFIKRFGAELQKRLKETSGEINGISIQMENIRPVFNGNYNMVAGLTILLNDTEQSTVRLESYDRLPNGKFIAVVEVTIMDHFGLDKHDVLSKQHIHDGFAAWWILQHNRGYVPFQTKVISRKTIIGYYN